MNPLSFIEPNVITPALELFTLFMNQGGPVLWVLAVVAGVCMLLIIERLIYILTVFPKEEKAWQLKWKQRANPDAWASRALREAWLFEAHTQLFRHLNLLKGLVLICPMLGLLGTVTGMIFVFDVQATQGVNHYRELASGISKATLPTFAGMLIAVVGAFSHARLARFCDNKDAALEQALRHHENK